jgi:hypothetical protein
MGTTKMEYRKRLEPREDTKYTNSWAGLGSSFVELLLKGGTSSLRREFLFRSWDGDTRERRLFLCFHATAVLLLRYDTLSISRFLKTKVRAFVPRRRRE